MVEKGETSRRERRLPSMQALRAQSCIQPDGPVLYLCAFRGAQSSFRCGLVSCPSLATRGRIRLGGLGKDCAATLRGNDWGIPTDLPLILVIGILLVIAFRANKTNIELNKMSNCPRCGSRDWVDYTARDE